MIAGTPGGVVIKIGIEQNIDNVTFPISADVCIMENAVRKGAIEGYRTADRKSVKEAG